MMRYLLSFGLGVNAGAAWAICSSVPEDHHFKLGQNDGQIMAKLDFANVVKNLGTDYTHADGYNAVGEVKDVAILQVERNGVKTLRLYNPGAWLAESTFRTEAFRLRGAQTETRKDAGKIE